jgi:hypothetical protein
VSHAPGHAITVVLQGLSPDIRTLAFDEADRLYVGYGGLQPMIERYDPPYALPAVIHRVSCDTTPAPGLWFDVTPQTLSAPPKRFAVYTCGTRQVRYVDLLSTSGFPSMNTPSTLLTTLPNLPGSDESARDVRLLAAVASDPLPSDAALDTILGAQGGMVIAYGTNVQWLTRAGALVSTFDFISNGQNALNGWCCLALTPTGGAIWSGDPASATLRRFLLTAGAAQPELAFNSGSGAVAALAVNGEPKLAQSTRFVSMTSEAPAAATFLAGTTWAHTISFKAVPDPSSPPPSLPVRFSVTSFETRSGGPFPDLNVDLRFVSLFPGTTSVSASHGRSNFYRVVRQSQQPYDEPHQTVVSVEYNLPTNPNGFLSGLYRDRDHGERGSIALYQMDENPRTEFFQTNEIIRGGTVRCCSDFVVGIQPAPPTTFANFSSSVRLGQSVPIRVEFPFDVTPQFCADLVLTVARPPATIVGSSLTTLNHNGQGNPYFTPLGQGCGANLDVTPNVSEVEGEIDFAAGRTYNVCVIKRLAPGEPPVSDVCGQMQVK